MPHLPEADMRYYRLGQNDQPKSSWVLYEMIKRNPNHIRPKEVPSVVSRLLGKIPEGELRLKDQYRHLRCSSCGRYDSYQMYDVGFAEPVQIRIKGDFAHTDDRVLVINDKFLGVLKDAKVGGYETKEIGKTGWHALRITNQVKDTEGTVTSKPPNCDLCGRPEEAYGLFSNEGHLDLPTKENTLFTTLRNWPYAFYDRNIFVTEKVAHTLKAAGIKGGYCSRLWSEEELQKREQKAAQGIKWKPPGMTIYL